MADDLDVTHGQFDAFLQKTAPEKDCPECGVNDWATQIAADEDQNAADPRLQIGWVFGGADAMGKALPLHSLHCQNCGYVKFFVASIVKARVSEL